MSAAICISEISAMVNATGFSTKTWYPFSRASMACIEWRPLGVAITTISIWIPAEYNWAVLVKKGTSFSLDDIRVEQSLNGKKLAGWRIDEDPKVIGVYSFLIINKDINYIGVKNEKGEALLAPKTNDDSTVILRID